MGVTIRQKNEDGPWWVFIAHRGKRKSKCVGDYDTARSVAKECRHALAAGDLGLLDDPDPAPTGPTFGAYVKTYLDATERTLKTSTWREYKRVANRDLVPVFGARELRSITRRDVKDLLHALRAAGRSAHAIRIVLSTLSTILSEAVDDEQIESNPVLQVRRRNKRAGARVDIVPFTPAELQAILKTARDHTVKRKDKTVTPYRRCYPLLLTLVQAGLRLGEVAALKVKDIDWQRRTLTIERSFVRGKIGLPKHDLIRRVHVPESLLDVLAAIIAERFDKVTAVGAEAEAERQIDSANARLDAWLFPDTTGRPMNTDNLRKRVWVPVLAAAKVQYRKLHNLRHTYASLMLQAGKELHFVQQQLGHADPGFTLRQYGHLIPRDRRGEVTFLDAVVPDALHSPAPGLHPEPESGFADAVNA